MTGAGVVLPDEDVVEVSKRFDDLHAQFNPATPMGKILVRRVAFLSIRLERSAEQEAAHLSKKVRAAIDDYDEECSAKVAEHLADLAANPSMAVRRLLRTPEGIDALIGEWGGLREDLVAPKPPVLDGALRAGQSPDGPADAGDPRLSGQRAVQRHVGRLRLIGPDEGAGLDDKGRRAWAKERLVELIDERSRPSGIAGRGSTWKASSWIARRPRNGRCSTRRSRRSWEAVRGEQRAGDVPRPPRNFSGSRKRRRRTPSLTRLARSCRWVRFVRRTRPLRRRSVSRSPRRKRPGRGRRDPLGGVPEIGSGRISGRDGQFGGS